MEPKERIILALDVSDHDEALDMVKQFKDHIDTFKVGSELFTSSGPKIVRDINGMGKKVFLDLKFHDIPNTVARAAAAAAELGVFMFNVHTTGGLEMMKQTAQELVRVSLKKNIERPKLLGVTVLTSIDQDVLTNEIGIQHRVATQVKHLAKMAMAAGLDGVVASPQDIEMIRAHCGESFLIVTPGIRPSWAPPDDQKRTMTPKQAVARGADHIVIGRAVMAQPSPIKALELILKELEKTS